MNPGRVEIPPPVEVSRISMSLGPVKKGQPLEQAKEKEDCFYFGSASRLSVLPTGCRLLI